MRIQTKKNKKHLRLALIISASLTVLLGGAIFAWFSPDFPYFGVKKDEVSVGDGGKKDINYDKPTSDQIEISNKTKQDFIDKKYKDSDGADDSVVEAGVIGITSAMQSGETVSIRAIIEGATPDGICKMVLTKGNLEIVRTAGVQDNGSYLTCQGFDMPASDIEAGEWVITATYTVQNITSPASKARITVSG